MPFFPPTKTSDRLVWILIQIGIVLIPIDVVFHLGGVRLTICEGIFSFALVVWGISKRTDLKNILPKEFFIPMAAFVAASAISIPAAQNKFAAIRETIQFVWIFSLFFMFLDLVRGQARLFRVSALLILSGTAVCMFGFYQYLFLKEPLDLMIAATRQRASAFYGQPNALGSYLIAVLPLLWGISVVRWETVEPVGWGMKLAGKRVFFGLLIVYSFVLTATFSRGSWLGFVLGVLVLLILLWKRVDRRLLFTTVLIVGVCAAVILIDSSLQPNIASRSFSNRQRVLLLATAVRMFGDHPLVGVGSGNFPVRLVEYADRELKEMLYWDYDKERQVFYVNPKKEPDVELVHNIVLQAAAENGIGGVVTLIWLFGLYFRRGWSRVRRALESGHSASFLKAGAFAGSVAVMGSAMFGWPFSHGVQEVLLLTMAIAASPDIFSGSSTA